MKSINQPINMSLAHLNQEIINSIIQSLVRLHFAMNHTPYEQLYSHLNNEIKMSHPHIIINLGVLIFIAIENVQDVKRGG